MIGKCRLFAAMALSAMISTAGLARAQAADLESTLGTTHVLTIGTSNDAPLSYIDMNTKAALGALPDILRAAMARMGIKADVQIVAMPFSSLIPSLTSGRIEMIGDSMYATPARQKIIGFTHIIFYNPEALDVVKGNPDHLHSMADLCGHIAGTYEGTAFVDLLRSASAACPSGKSIDIRLYPTLDNVFADLSAGRLDAAVAASSLSAYALKQNPALNFQIVADYKPVNRSKAGSAIGVVKGNEAFLNAFNTAYTGMLTDGTAAAIFSKWGLTPPAFFLHQ